LTGLSLEKRALDVEFDTLENAGGGRRRGRTRESIKRLEIVRERREVVRKEMGVIRRELKEVYAQQL